MHFMNPFMKKVRLAFYVPKEVHFYTKYSLRMVDKLFLYAYNNAHSIGNEEVIMVIMQTGSELLFNAYLNCHYEKMIGTSSSPRTPLMPRGELIKDSPSPFVGYRDKAPLLINKLSPSPFVGYRDNKEVPLLPVKHSPSPFVGHRDKQEEHPLATKFSPSAVVGYRES